MAPPRTMHWFRWYHGTANDSKLRRIATHADTSVANVVAVWAMVLESASENIERGTVGSWDADDVAFTLGIEPAIVFRITTAMQGKLLDGQRVTNWSKRQPKREKSDSSITDESEHIGADGSNSERMGPRGEERRGEKKRIKEKATDSSSPPAPTHLPFVAEATSWWSEHVGKVTPKRVSAVLKAPVEARTWAVVFPAMQRYVREQGAKGRSVKLEWFAESYVQWLPKPVELDANGDPTPAQLERWAAL